jgi:lipoprotein-releasing system permease protein
VIAAPIEWVIALRFMREGRMQSALIITGVTVGVAVIVFLTTLIDTLQTSLIDRVLGSQAHIVVRPPEEVARRVPAAAGDAVTARVEPRAQRLRSIDQWESLYPQFSSASGVTAASPLVSGPGFAARGSASKSVVLMGIDPDRYRRIVKLDTDIVAGAYRIGGTDALIGIELAADLGVGDKLRVTTAEGGEDVLTVAGIFDVGSRDLNRRWVFVTLRVAQTLLALPGGVTSIDLAVERIFDAQGIAERLQAQTGLKVESWMQTNAQLLAALRNQTISNSLIRSFVVMIVALGISSVLVVSVVQKQKEIGILRAMGASRQRIMIVFLLQGATFGLAGSVAGAGLGTVLLHVFSNIYRNADGTPIFSPEIAPRVMAVACVTAIVVGLVAAAVPARRAASLDPATAIRHG